MNSKSRSLLSSYQTVLFRIPYGIFVVVFVLMPVFVFTSICFVKHIDVSALSTAYNDEVSWFNQAMAVAEYGKPLGYWGYNGTHADIGTFGAWGPVSVYFFALFLKPLKWLFPSAGVSIYIFNNLLWACTANLLFVLLSKPRKNNMLRLIVIHAFLFVNHCYMFEAMSETIRFSMGVILAGISVFLLRRRESRGYKCMLYAIAPVVLLLFMSAYIMFAVIVPVWLYAVYQDNSAFKKKKVAFVLVSGIGFIAVSLTVYFVTGKFTSPYVTDGVTDILKAFQSDFVYGVYFLLQYILDNIGKCDLKFILSSTNVYGGFFVFYLPLYYSVCIYLILSSVVGWKKMKKPDLEIQIIGAFVMTAFMAAFIVLYSTYYWILVRGINIALVFTLYLLCMKEKPAEIMTIAAVSVLGVIPFMLVANNTFIYGRTMEENASDYSEVFSQYIHVSEGSDPWENTIACYGDETRECLGLPVGMSINSMMNKKSNQNARYAMIWMIETSADEMSIEDPDALMEELEPNHDLLYRDENLILMIRTGA